MRVNQKIPVILKRGAGLDSGYQAVLDRAAVQGYTAPSAAQQTLQSNLVKSLKSAGIWDSLDVFYCFANDGSALSTYMSSL